MTVCPHTGVTVPECSCRECVRALIERHMPSRLAPAERPDARLDGRRLGLARPARDAAVRSLRRPRPLQRLRSLRQRRAA